jgi:hypothetical protein
MYGYRSIFFFLHIQKKTPPQLTPSLQDKYVDSKIGSFGSWDIVN